MKRSALLVATGLLFVGAMIASAQAVDDTLVLALSFDEGTGNTVKDASANSFKGNITGAKWADGKFGGALEFDGVDDVLMFDDAPALRLLEGGTFMTWAYIKVDAGHADWPRILIKANSTGGTNGYDLLFDRALGYAVRFCIGGACQSTTAVETETWHHLAVTFDGTTILVYIDGDEVAELPQPGAPIDTPDLGLAIGNAENLQRPYQGLYDEMRIWTVPLSAADIKWHMDRGSVEVFPVQPKGKMATVWGGLKSE